MKKKALHGPVAVRGNDGVPDLDIFAREGVDVPALAEWLRAELGAYRSGERRAKRAPSKHEELKGLRELRERCSAAEVCIREMKAALYAGDYFLWIASDEAGTNWGDAQDSLMKELHWAISIIAEAERQLAAYPVKLGRPTPERRDKLLSGLVVLLRNQGFKADPARQLATEILAACGVKSPKSGRAVRGAQRRIG